MARSALFRALRRLANRAHAKNLGPDAPTTGPSRRQVLVGSLAAGAILPLAAACGDNKAGPSDGGNGGDGPATPRIAIIGAGIAGVSCAHWLSLAGVTSTVYEASMRVGGRQFTQHGLAGNQLCELGGELVDTDHFVLPILAQAYGKTLDDLVAATAGLTDDSFFFQGHFIPENVLVDQFMPVATKMAAAVTAGDASDTEFERIDNMSIPDWLANEAMLPTTSLIRQILELSYLEEFGLEVANQSAWNLITLIDYDDPEPFHIFGDSDERFHIHEGSDSVALAIAAELSDQILFDHALTKVTTDGTTFTLTFSTSGGDTTVTADHVVYALPFTKLREVDLDGAQLPDEKLIIINSLGYGTNAKLMMQFTERHWATAHSNTGSLITDAGTGTIQTTWDTARGQDGDQGILTNFVGGDRGIAIGDMTAEQQAAIVLPLIDVVYPGTAATYIANSAIRQHWPTYPYTKGSYASYLVGQWAFFTMEGQRVGNQHFCGEHCSENFQGYMEGGAETGTMVAAEVLDDLGIAQPASLASIIATLTADARVRRACYHGDRGTPMTIKDRAALRRRRVARR
ncbi:MAG TPA: NAD(P)/FAD-dependent oxidoreductase [Kofleriaceae bacterium]|jgi:monoamine oxidase